METYKLNLCAFTDKGRADALKICRRMGWCYDEDSDAATVNVPIEDKTTFEFIFEYWL